MEEIEVDVYEYEKQRKEEIKKSNKYLEFDIVISAKEDDKYGLSSHPVIMTELHNCGPEEIAKLYVLLKEEIKNLEDDYPMECLYGTLHLKSSTIQIKGQYEKKEDKDENNSI